MANDLAARPLKIDTAMGTPANLGRPLRVKKVYWENPTTLAHTFVIDDGSTGAKVLIEGRCEVANQSQAFDFAEPVVWKNFKATTIASGILWIYAA
jgi:hypothetical protein